ncbi:MAG TPA: glycosyltransferase [Alphaproteobacteria bacterium]|nr:glycosyltransferase [Alphaproteobacteria bacterium]
MRVCHVVEAGGGVGNVVIDLARAGIEAGDDVTVVYAPHRQWPGFVENLKAIPGLKLVTTPMQREVGLHDVLDCIKLYRTLRRLGYFEVIHAHSSKAGALVRLLRVLFPKSVVIYTPHAFMTMAPDASPIYGWIERLLSHFCDAIICVSKQEKEHALKLGISPKLLHVIPNGVQTNYPANRLMARTRLGFAEDDFIVGFVGRLVPQKNPGRMVTAFFAAATQRPNLRLAIIGHGLLQPEVENALTVSGIRGKVKIFEDFNGRNFMPGFDCLLCSSDYESFGLVILEALAAGVPVVTTPVGIAEEAVVSGKTGYVTADFEPLPLAISILAIAALDPLARDEMFREARERAEVFSISRMSRETRSLYSQLLGR